MILLINSGCATVMYRADIKNDFPPSFYAPYYPATVADLYFCAFTATPICIIDLPFSLASDTLLLPYDFFKEQKKQQEEISMMKRYEEQQAKRQLEAQGKRDSTEKQSSPQN